MADQREKLLFGIILVLVVGMSWLRLDAGHRRMRAPVASPVEAAVIELPADIRLGALTPSVGATRERSVFAPPRELLPMDPLVLADPPLPLVSVRRPAVTPSLQGRFARAYRLRPEQLGGLNLPDGDGVEPGGDTETPESGASGSSGAPGGSTVAVADGLGQAVLEERFDWFVRLGTSRRLYGRILNPDLHGLRDRSGEDVVFQQVSERHGGPVGLPYTVVRAEVERFGLAATFENAYRSKTRELGSGHGSVSARRALAIELLRAWPAEPLGLELAQEEAERAAAAGPTDAATDRLLATVARERQDVESELAVYTNALDAGHADGALLAGYARLARRLGLPERAVALVDHANAISRASAEVRFVEGLLLLDQERWAEAQTVLQEATQLPLAGPLEDEWRAQILLALGRAQIATGQADAARAQAERILLDQPEHIGALRLLAAAHAASDDVTAAAEVLDRALAVKASGSVVLTDAAIIAWRQGDGAGALGLLERARDLDPYRAVRPTLALGFLNEDAGRHEAARELYAEVLELQPGHPVALYRLGRNQRRDGDPDAAVATLRRALRLTGPGVLLLTELGRASIDRGDVEAARRYLREAERIEPDNGEVQWYLGLAALYAGDVHAAPGPLERAVELDVPGAHVGLGVAAYRRGEAKAALDHFDEVSKIFAGRGDDPQAVYAADQALRIRENLSKRQWLDRFGRTTLQRGWLEHHWDGSPRVFLDQGRLHVEGRMESPRPDERPGITRPLDGLRFGAVVAELTGDAAGETRYGVSLTYRQVRGAQGRLPKATLDIHVDGDGVVRTSVLDNFNNVVQDAEPVEGVTVTPGQPVRLGIERIDDVNGIFVFTVEGRQVGEPVSVKALRTFKNSFDLSVYAESAPGSQTSAEISMVRIVRAP